MQIKFSFSRTEFQRASLRARPLVLQSADASTNVELIGPIDVSPIPGAWRITSPGLIRHRIAHETFRIPVEQLAFDLRSGALSGSGENLSLGVELKQLHLFKPSSVREEIVQALAQRMNEAHSWRLKFFPVAKQLQGGNDNLLSSLSFRKGEVNLFHGTGEFAVELETLVNVKYPGEIQRSCESTPSVEKSTPAIARLLTTYSEVNLASERLMVPRRMRGRGFRERQLPMPLEARG